MLFASRLDRWQNLARRALTTDRKARIETANPNYWHPFAKMPEVLQGIRQQDTVHTVLNEQLNSAAPPSEALAQHGLQACLEEYPVDHVY